MTLDGPLSSRRQKESKTDLNKFQMEIYLQECSRKHTKEGNGSFKGMVQDTQLIDF